MSQVIVVGSFNVDHVWRCAELPAVGATIAGQYATGPGGKGFNQAVAAARAGAHTAFVCSLGDDPGGTLARHLASAEGIGLYAEASDQPTGTAGIYVDARGRNSIVIGAGANGSLSAAVLAADPGLLAGARGRPDHHAQSRAGQRHHPHRPARSGRCAHAQRDRIRRPARPPCR